MPTLYLLCGLPFSGKSTLARRLRDECGFEIVSLDAINEERGLCGEDGLSVGEWEATNLLARERVKAFMNAHCDVVVDDTNCFRWIRDRWRGVATEAGYATVVVYLPADAGTLRRRIESCTDRRRITKEVFDGCVLTFEPPSDETTVVVGDPDAIEAFFDSRHS